MIDSPFSRFTEAIRSIKLAIDLNNGSINGKQVIGFSSSLPNEGKSTIALRGLARGADRGTCDLSGL